MTLEEAEKLTYYPKNQIISPNDIYGDKTFDLSKHEIIDFRPPKVGDLYINCNSSKVHKFSYIEHFGENDPRFIVIEKPKKKKIIIEVDENDVSFCLSDINNYIYNYWDGEYDYKTAYIEK